MLKKRSILIAGHATSVTMEPPFWDWLKILADQRGQSINQLMAEIDQTRDGNLSSAVRVWVLQQVSALVPAGHTTAAGQGPDSAAGDKVTSCG